MFPTINPSTTNAWKALQAYYNSNKELKMKNLFATDAERFSKYSLMLGDIYFDYSKNIITTETLQLLLQLAEECQLKEGIEGMFAGEKINATENRAVLHTALRNFSGKPLLLDGEDIMPGIQKVQAQMKDFCNRLHSGEW